MRSKGISRLICTMMALWMAISLGERAYAQKMPITTENDQARAAFMEGRTLYDNLRQDEARVSFDKALQADSEFALAHVYRALTAENDQVFQQHFQKAVDLKDQVSDGERMLIEAMQHNVNQERMVTISTLKEALKEYPDDEHLHHLLALNYQTINKPEKALAHLEKAVEINPDFAPAYNNMGYLYREMGDYAQSEKAFKKYVEMLPDEANPHDSIADLYARMGRHDEAIKHYKMAVDINPRFYISQQKIGDNLIFQGKYEDGDKAYAEAMNMALTPVGKIWMQQAHANTYLYRNDIRRAVLEGDKALKMAAREKLPEVEAMLNLNHAFINIENGNYPAARENLSKCGKIVDKEELTPSRKANLNRLMTVNEALLAIKTGELNQATDKAEWLRQRAEMRNDPAQLEDYRLVLGMIKYAKDDFDGAIWELQQSNKNSPYALYQLAMSYEKAGKTDEASKLFDKVANWNEHNLEYAVLRNKAKTAAKAKVVGLDDEE